MSNIPEKCSRCGAPIDWDDGAAFTKCEFCGFKNYLTNYDQKEVFKNDSIKFKISNFKNPFNRSFKNSLGFFESKFKSTKSLVSINKKTILFVIIAGVSTSIAIPSIKNYSNFVANKRTIEQLKQVNAKIIKEDQISGSNNIVFKDPKEEKIIYKTKKVRPQWMVEKIQGCSKYKTQKQIEFCINIYSPFGNPVPKDLKTFTKSWELEINERCSFYEFVEERDYCKEVYSPYKSASLEDKKRIDSNGSIYKYEILENKFYDGMQFLKNGFIQYQKGDYQNALVYAYRYLKYFPNDALVISNVGVLYFYLNDYQKSIEESTNAIEIDPNHNWAYYWRAEALVKEGKYINAIQDLKKHLLITPDHKDAKKLLKKAKRKI